MRAWVCLSSISLLAGCGGPPAATAPQQTLTTAPQPVPDLPLEIEVDPATLEGWRYRHTITADLDNDGRGEAVVIAADVETLDDGTPLWEDGHRWVVFVADGDAAHRLLYAAFVPHGRVAAAVLEPGAEGQRAVLVVERTPYRLRTLTVRYAAGAARLDTATEHIVESWLPER